MFEDQKADSDREDTGKADCIDGVLDVLFRT